MSETPSSPPTFSSARRWSIALNSLLGIVAFLAVVIMLNYIAGGHFLRFQWATSSQLRLSAQTLSVLKPLTNDVSITIFFDPRDEEELYGLTSGLLAEYRNANPNHIAVKTLDYSRFDGEARQLLAKHNLSGLKDKNFVLIESGGRSKIFYGKNLADYDVSAALSGKKIRRNAFRGEILFTSGIFAVSYPRQLKSYFLYGHSEHNPESTEDGDGCSKLAAILKDEISTDWSRLSLQGTNPVPADCQLLIIAGPRKGQFLLSELEKIDQYLKQGGRLLALLNNRASSGIERTLAKWGVGVGTNNVFEQNRNYMLSKDGSEFYTATMSPHPIVNPLIADDLPVRMIAPRAVFPLNPATKSPDAPEVKVLAATSPTGTDGQEKGSFPLAIAVEQGVIKGVRTGGLRMVVVGDAYFLADQMIDAGGANHEFANLALNWLLERPEMLIGGLVPRPIKEYKLLITNSQTRAVQWIFLAGMPGFVLLIGGLIWLRRRS